MRLPKILIFGQPFNQNTGGGITISNLFNGWDSDKIAVVGTGHMLKNLNTGICNTYYQLGSDDYKWVFPFNKMQRKFKSGIIDIDKEKLKSNNSNHHPNIYQKPNIRQKIVDDILYPSLKYTGIFHRLSSITLTSEFCRWLQEYSPEILYIQVQARDEILFVQELHTYLKIPMIIHIMDDWPSYVSARGLFKSYWRKKIDADLRRLFNNADILMSISEQMAKEYKNRYNKKFITFHNPIEIPFWNKNQRKNYDLSANPTILYAGRMGVGIESSLELIAKAILKVNKELGISIKFILQTQEKISWFDKYCCVVHRPFVEYDELPMKFSEADFLILPYDFTKISMRYIKYSMPTKVSEYMISGSPIIVFAPKETAMATYAEEYQWAKVICENDSNVLAEAIKELIENKEERERIAENAIRIAEKNHNSVTVRKNFKELICSVNTFDASIK